MTQEELAVLINFFEQSFSKKDYLVPSIRDFSERLKTYSSFCNLGKEVSRYADFREILTYRNESFVNPITDLINQCHKHLLSVFPSLELKIEGRLKGFLSFFFKELLLFSENEPYCNLPDLIGVRFIISDSKEIELSMCYKITHELISYLLANHNCVLSIPTSSKNKTNDFSGILLPKKSDLDLISEHSVYIKDYINNPKTNGYQSIHLLIWIPKIKQYIEFQIRSSYMHAFAEFNQEANHTNYKSIRYSKEDIQQISDYIFNYNSNTFGITSINDKITDSIGYSHPWYFF